ncbi:MAG: ATP-dependent helicase, partial [Deltaproteobacteria bacterium]|nr:ATP-dependent helicase [Deltaproteobacteria bacterium]
MLDVPFAMRAVATASGARWDASHGVFLFEGAALPPALAPFQPPPYSWERHVQREL